MLCGDLSWLVCMNRGRGVEAERHRGWCSVVTFSGVVTTFGQAAVFDDMILYDVWGLKRL